MSEESKKKKLVYEVPRLVKIGDVTAKGDCGNGSGDDTSCNTGSGATDSCPQGSSVLIN